MPSLSRWLNSLGLNESGPSSDYPGSKLIPTENSSPGTSTTYYLAPFLPSDIPSRASLIHVVPPPNRSQIQPSGSLHFGFTHPSPTQSPTAFFFSCVPDPIGFLAHSASFIRSQLGTGSAGPSKWRHNRLHLILEDQPGLAYTSGGLIHISLQWVGDVMREVQIAGRDHASAVREFKGVLLHELVHAIQYDGHGTAPSWLTESIADYVRLQAQLGPAHWRHPGQGKAERGWEDGYDVGAQFLSWVVGTTGAEDKAAQNGASSPTPTRSAPTFKDDAPPAQSTQYPTDPRPPGPAPVPQSRTRPGPWPDLVKRLNASLEHGRYTEQCWEDLTGQRGGLEGLWEVYLGHYR